VKISACGQLDVPVRIRWGTLRSNNQNYYAILYYIQEPSPQETSLGPWYKVQSQMEKKTLKPGCIFKQQTQA
jgi:hypothetical protein